MGIRVYVLVVFITSVCQGAAVPSQRLDCVTYDLFNQCIESNRKTESSLQNSPEPCAAVNQCSERRRRQVEAVQPIEAQPVNTSTQPTPTEAQQSIENSTSAGLASSSTAVSSPEVVPSLPPPPHPSATQATAVKPRSCKSGSTWEEECNTCWCLDNGMAACTVKRCEVISPVAAAKTTVLPTGTTPAASTPTPSAPVTSPTPSATTSVQSETTPVQSETTPVQSQTTSVQDSSSVQPTSSTTPVQSSTSSSGGTS